jgi:hypothetical protein
MCELNLQCWLAFLNFDFWQSFVSNLLATLIGAGVGAGLGFYGALRLNKHLENVRRKETKSKILEVLLSEIKENLNTLDIWKNTGKNFQDPRTLRDPLIVLYTNLYTDSWDAFSNGGELEWIDDPTTLDILGSSYHRVRDIKYLSDNCINFVFSENRIFDLGPLEIVGEKLNRKINAAILTLGDTKELLEILLKKLNP